MAARSTISLGIEVTGGEAFKAALKACDAETKALNAEMQRLATSQSAADKGSQGMAQRMQLLGQAVENGKSKITLLTNELDKAKQHLSTLATELDRARQSGDPEAINRAATAYERQRTVVAQLETNLAQTRQQTDQAANSMQRMSGINLDKVKSAIEGVARGMVEAGKAAAQMANEIINKMQSVVTGLTVAGTAVVVGLGKVGLDYNRQMEGYVTNFATLLGSTEAAAKKVEELKKMAASTPFSMEDLAQATQTLLSFGIEADKTQPILKALGDVSLGNKEKFQSLSLAFGQVSSAGKLTGQDLNQMINAGFNPLNEISKRTGETMEQLRDRMSKGGISAKEVEQAFIDATSAGGQFNNGMESASKTMDGLISTLKDNATSLIGQVFEPITNTIKDTLLPTALEYVQKLTDAFTKDGLPGLVQATGECLRDILQKITSEGPAVINAAIGIIQMITQELTRAMPELVKTGAVIVENIMQGLNQTLPQLGPIVAEIAPLVVNTIIKFKSELLNAGIQIIADILEGLSKEAPQIVQTILSCMDSLINTIIQCLPKILDSAAQIVLSINEGIYNNIPKAVDAIIKLVESLVDWILSNLGMIIDAAFKIAETIATTLLDNAPKIVDSISNVIMKALDWITGNLDRVIDTMLQFIMSMVKSILDNAPKVVDAISTLIKKLLDWIINNLDKVVSTILEFVLTISKTLIDNTPKVVDAIQSVINSLLSWIIDHLDEVIVTATKIVLAIAEALIKGIPQVLKSVASIISNIVRSLGDAISQIWQCGVNLVKGLWDGIAHTADWLWKQITGWIGGVVDGIKGFLGIKSPSRVFAGIGENIGLGLAEGIAGTAGIVQSALDGIMPSAGNIALGADTVSVAGRVAESGGYTPWVDNRPIILTLNDRELGRAVRGYA